MNALYSGNIGSMQWQNTANGEQHKYDFTYDSLGRLTGSHYSSSANGSSGRFDESLTYNPNGSVTSLLRNGMKNNGTFGLIDSLAIIFSRKAVYMASMLLTGMTMGRFFDERKATGRRTLLGNGDFVGNSLITFLPRNFAHQEISSTFANEKAISRNLWHGSHE